MKWFSRKPYMALLISMTVVAAIPLLFSVLLYWGASSIVNDQVDEIVWSAHLQYQQKVDQALNDLNRIAIRASASPRIMSVLKIGQELNANERMVVYDARSELNDYVKSGPSSIRDIYIHLNDTGFAITQSAMYDTQTLYKRYYQNRQVSDDELVQLHHEYSSGMLHVLGDNGGLLVYSRTLPIFSRTELPERQLIVLLNENFFKGQVDRTSVLESQFFLIDADNATFLAGDHSLELPDSVLAELDLVHTGGRVKVGDETRIFYATRSQAGNYLVCSLVSQEYLEVQTRNLKRLSSFILFACFLFAAAAVLVLSRQNYTPIGQLQKYIQDNFRSQDTKQDRAGIYAIQATVQQLIVEKQLAEQQMLSYRQAIGISYLKCLLQGEGESYALNNQTKPPCVTWTDDRPFAVACFHLIPSILADEDRTNGDLPKQMETDELINLAIDAVLSQTCFWEFTSISGLHVVVFGSQAYHNDIDWFAVKIEQVIHELEEKHGLIVQAAISNLHTGTDKLEAAYREAVLAIEHNLAQSDSFMTRFDACDLKASFYLRDMIHIDKLLHFSNLVTAGKIREASVSLDSLFPDTFMENVMPESEVLTLQFASLKYQFLHVADDLHAQCTCLTETRNDTIKRILYSKNHLELKEIMRDLLFLASEQMPVECMMTSQTLSEVKAFIESHYTDNQLSASSIAAHFGVAANTLSKYFSRKTGTGLLQFIHMVRIKKAHELMMNNPDLSTPEIAGRVGYCNNLTFTRSFKSCSQGMTPGEYRKAFLSQVRS